MKRLVLTPTRLAWAALIIGVATYGVVWLATYKSLTLNGRRMLYGLGPHSHVVLPPQMYASPTWTIPVAAFVGISAIGAVILVLGRR
jgi:hypothetical protein